MCSPNFLEPDPVKIKEKTQAEVTLVTQVEDTVSMVSSTSSGYGSQQRESGE